MKREQIKAALSYSGVTASSVADQLGVSRQTFSKRSSRETWTDSELEQIAGAIGAKYKCVFVFPDGKEI